MRIWVMWLVYLHVRGIPEIEKAVLNIEIYFREMLPSLPYLRFLLLMMKMQYRWILLFCNFDNFILLRLFLVLFCFCELLNSEIYF